MANEVIIEEYSSTGLKTSKGYAVPVPGTLLTTQIIDIASLSATFSPATVLVRIQSKGTGFWYILGTSGASAAANTDGNRWLPADQFRDIIVNAGVETNLDTAA